jgi:NADH:ubiquinone oxidoreductase subunit E
VDVVEVVCLDECGMGPNVQCGEDGPIVNGVKTQDDVDEAVAKAKAE